MIAVDALRDMNVMFATPCYNRNTTSIYTSSIFNLGGDCMVDPETRNYLSEDFAFSYLWRKIGGKLWVDFKSKLNHLGQHVFRGDLKAAVLAQGG